MSPAFLIAGATGNTGRNTVRTLSQLITSKTAFSDYKIIALTRSAESPAAQDLATIPAVQIVQKHIADVTVDWLSQNNVERVFIAPPTDPAHFALESHFLVEALHARVQYVVRISTTGLNVRPDSAPFYARAHWAVEALLSAPEFAALQWTSLEPNSFAPLYLTSAANFVKEFRATGEQGVLSLMADKDAPAGIVHPDDIGAIAAHLLVSDDPAIHNKGKYVVNGPEDITGAEIATLVEEAIGETVKEVKYRDTSVFDMMASRAGDLGNLFRSVKAGREVAWQGKCSASTTSEVITKMGLLKHRPIDVWKQLID